MDQKSLMYTANDANGSLEHHGILGMKWGVRRYQPYPDGKRVAGGKEIGKAAKVRQDKSNKNKIKKQKKSTSEMSDEELRNAINRMKLENDFKQLRGGGSAFVNGTLKRSGSKVLDKVATATLIMGANLVAAYLTKGKVKKFIQ